MDAAALFDLASAGALVGWMMLAVLYSGLLAGAVMGGGMEGDFTSLAGVTALFARPEGVLVGWVHYLAFDLWVGAWAAEDAHRRGLKHAFVLPCLVFIFLAGPLGLLLYLAARSGLARDKAFA